MGEDFHAVVELIAELREERITVQRKGQQVRGVEVVAVEVREEPGVDVHVDRILEVLDLQGRVVAHAAVEQGAVEVEAERTRAVAHRAGRDAIGGEERLDRRERDGVGGVVADRTGRRGAGGGGGERGEGTLALGDRFTEGAVEAEDGVALAVGEVAAEHGREVVFLGVLEVGGVRVAGAQIDAFEVALDLQVHDTGHGVGAVGGARAAGDDFDRLNHRLGDGVEVDGQGVGRHHRTAAVHENQVAVGAEAAKVDVRLARVAGVVRGGRTRRVNLGQGVQIGVQGDVSVRDGLLTGHGRDRAGGDIVLTDDARAGDDHFGHFSVLSESRGGAERRESGAADH